MVKIITDSASDFEPNELKKLMIDCIPLSVNFGDEEYKDNVTISKDEFFDKLKNTTETVKTSQPSLHDIVEEFEVAEHSKDGGVAIFMSSKISGTANTAQIACDMIGCKNVYVIDSLTASAGQKLLVEYAVKLRRQGKNSKEIYEEIERIKTKISLLACLDTLEYLHNGGRVSQTKAMLTTVARAGELELVSHTKQADGLHFRVTSLSPFGVSWVKYAAPSGGGSGGSGGSGGGIFNPAYNIMVERTMNGSITVSPSSAAKGSTVTIMVYPDRGYELEMLMVMDKKGSELDLRKWGGEYSFIMPAGDVTVRARFVEEAPTQSFADVSTDAYYYEAVKWAAKNGITGGVGNGLFAPDAPCTRAQIVTFLWRAAGSPEPKNASSFSDVPASAYYARSVAWAVENGITTGTGNGRFSPDATCTRAQSVTFLYRALSTRAEGTAEFRDVPKNAYYADAVAWAAANGITTGIGGGLFGPDNDCTRAQIVTFLFRTYNK